MVATTTANPKAGHGAVQQAELGETNSTGASRQVVIKMRGLKGKKGRAIRVAVWTAHRIVLPVAKLVCLPVSPVRRGLKQVPAYTQARVRISHRAVSVDPYVWELDTDPKGAKFIAPQRLTGNQIWESNVKNSNAGFTTLTDKQIEQAANQAYHNMRSRWGGKYNILFNNCQDFVEELCKEIKNLEEQLKNEKLQAEMIQEMVDKAVEKKVEELHKNPAKRRFLMGCWCT